MVYDVIHGIFPHQRLSEASATEITVRSRNQKSSDIRIEISFYVTKLNFNFARGNSRDTLRKTGE